MGGSYTTLDVAGSAFTNATGINSKRDADIVGLWTDASRYAHSYLLSGGIYTKLDDIPGSTATYALGINAAGQIIGGYLAGSNHGFLRMSDGSYKTIDVPRSTDTQAEGINDSGQIAGRYFAGGNTHGFLLSENVYTTFDVGLDTEALGINDLGQMVGSYLAGGTEHGFLRMRDGSYMMIDVPGSSTRAIGINDFGEIVGQYIDAGGHVHGFLATPTPEPSTLLLLAIGTLGVIGWTCRRHFTHGLANQPIHRRTAKPRGPGYLADALPLPVQRQHRGLKRVLYVRPSLLTSVRRCTSLSRARPQCQRSVVPAVPQFHTPRPTR